LKLKQGKQRGKVGEQHLQLTQNLKLAENKMLSIKRLFKTCIYSRANWNAELTYNIRLTSCYEGRVLTAFNSADQQASAATLVETNHLPDTDSITAILHQESPVCAFRLIPLVYSVGRHHQMRATIVFLSGYFEIYKAARAGNKSCT
jgi:hypothetical protein